MKLSQRVSKLWTGHECSTADGRTDGQTLKSSEGIIAILKPGRNRKFDCFRVKLIFTSLMNTKSSIFICGITIATRENTAFDVHSVKSKSYTEKVKYLLSLYSLKLLHETGPEVIKLFSYSTQLSTKFFLLIIVKMPTVVGILTFKSRKIAF